MLVVYLSSKYVRVVEGEASPQGIKVKGTYYAEDEKDVIQNGNIADEEGLCEMLSKLWESNVLPKKDVHLVLDSMQFSGKMVLVPKLKESKVLEYIGREFSGVDRINNPVYGYFPVKSQEALGRMQQVYAMAAPRDYLLQFVEVFRKIGVKLDGIESSSGAIIRLVSVMKSLQGQTCVLQFVDGMSLLSILLIKGVYENANRKNLFSQPGTPGYAVETARAMNNLLQFVKGQNLDVSVTNVYEAGMDQDDYFLYSDSIANIDSELMVDKLGSVGGVSFLSCENEEQEFSKYALALGGLVKTSSKTNMIMQIEHTPEELAAMEQRRKTILPMAIILAVMLVTAAALFVRVMVKQKQYDALVEYNQSTEVVTACGEYDGLSAKTQSGAQVLNSLERLKEVVEGYPEVDVRIENLLKACAGDLATVDLIGYDSATGVVDFKASSSQVEKIHLFVRLLMDEKTFDSVTYSGYSQSEDGVWSVKVGCAIRIPETEEESQ